MVIKLLLVALVAACLGASAAAAALLLAVGAVSSTSARVLVDGAGSGLLVRVLRASDGALQAEKRLQERAPGVDRPRALELDGLAPSTRYTVEFLDGEAEGEVVWLRTAPERAEQAKVLVVSCDRFVDDEDDELWRWFAREAEHSPSYFGVAHIGDQVYVDAGDARVPVAPLPLEQTRDEEAVRARYDALVDAFRGIYRATFGRPVMQRVLRRGAHWMLPDDHEVLNNVNRERVERAFKGWTDEARSDDERALLFELTLHHRAGMQVFYEFQYQLQRDVPWDRIDFLLQPLDEIIRDLPLHFSVDVGALKLFFLDARYDRAFLPETGASELIGDTQSAALTTELQRWQVERERTNSPVTAVVLANLPLFFHSSLSAAIAYMVEKESYPGLADHRISLEKLLATLINPNQSVVRLVVGGDVHMMAHSQICRSSQDFHCVDQLITSGVTNGSTAIEDVKLIPFYYLITRLTPLVDFLFDTSLSIFPETVQNNLNAALGRAPWRTSYDRVFLGRNYGVLVIGDDGGFDWKQTVVAAHGRTSQHLVQTFFDLTASFWFHGAILTFFVAANIVATRRATRWLCTSKRPSVHKAKQQ